MAQALLEPFDLRGRLILADKGYDSDKFVRWVEERGGIVVIPSRVDSISDTAVMETLKKRT